MPYLIDTGILLRLVDELDPLHGVVSQVVNKLVDKKQKLFVAVQNFAEFWSVATRPVADNGLGLQPAKALSLLEVVIEPICTIVIESNGLYDELKRLVIQYGVGGKQVHDARLVAMMLVWNIDRVLTLNERDFNRYQAEGITAVTPQSLLLSGN